MSFQPWERSLGFLKTSIYQVKVDSTSLRVHGRKQCLARTRLCLGMLQDSRVQSKSSFRVLIFLLLVYWCQTFAGDVRLAALIFLIVNLVWTTEFRIKKVHNRSNLWVVAALVQSLSMCPKGCPWLGSNSLGILLVSGNLSLQDFLILH